MDLGLIREQIDAVDRELVALFEKRMDLCKDVAAFKIENNRQVLDPEREKQKIEKIGEITEHEEYRQSTKELFKQIMAMSRKMQYKMLAEHGLMSEIGFREIDELPKENKRIVYQGVEGAYAHEAALQYFGDEADTFHVDTWRDAMEAVKNKEADYAVLPIENSTAGAVTQVYDLLIEYGNYILGETFLKVEHSLVGMPEAELSGIQTVYSHPQALMQSAAFLEEHREWKQVSLANTAVSAKKVCEDRDVTQAAIASKRAAAIYGLKVLQENIQNQACNTTRFVIVGREQVYRRDAGKVSISFEIPHESGSLYDSLSHFLFNNINLTNIESRPIEGRNWEYHFIIDFEGNLCDAKVKNALRSIGEEAGCLKILGNY